MNVDEWGLSPRQNERLRAVLEDDERVVMVVRPRRRMHSVDAFFMMLPGMVLAVFLGWLSSCWSDKWWVAVLVCAPLWVVAVGLLTVSLRYRWRMARTLYLLTDKRAIVFEQLTLWRNRCVCWPLFPGLVKRVTKDAPDLGSLIFDYEIRWSFRERKRVPQPVGFLAVPQPEQVRQLVTDQVASMPEHAVPFAYRPAHLRSPAPKLDAWGSPLSQEPWKRRDDSAPLLVIGTGFVLLASLVVVIGLAMLHTERRLEAEGETAVASVVSVRESSGGSRNSSVTYFPTLRFTDAAGVPQVVEYTIGKGTYNFPIGYQLPVRYLPSEPSTLRIVEDGMSSGLLFSLYGGGFGLIGCGIFFLGMKMRARR